MVVVVVALTLLMLLQHSAAGVDYQNDAVSRYISIQHCTISIIFVSPLGLT